nr:M24 family metallopeptidase [Natranaerobius thermophilus]
MDACVNWNRRAWRGLSAIVPLMPSGENTGACHLTWTDRKYQENDAIILELSGCYRRYHSPMARTIFLGDNPPQELQRMADIVAEGVNTTLEFIKPGVTCEEIEATWAGVLKNTA